MRQQRIGALVLRTYPPSFRSARGEEMLGTLLDAGEDSSGAFIQGCASLVIGGLRERARDNARPGARRLITGGLCQAAVLWSLYRLLGGIRTGEAIPIRRIVLAGARAGEAIPVRYGAALPVWQLALLAAVVVGALLGRDRLAGLCGLALAGYVLVHACLLPDSSTLLVWFVDHWLGPLVCFAAMALRPRIRPPTPARLIWLIPVAVLFVISPQLVGVLLLVGVPVLAIVELPVDPRLAIASAVFWADIAASSTLGHVRLGLVTLPVILLAMLIAAAQARAAGRRTPA